MMKQLVSTRIKEFFPDGFWLYVDSSEGSKEIIEEMELFNQAGMVTVYDIFRDGGFKSSHVSLPFLRRNGDVIEGRDLRRFIGHLKKLNTEFLLEEKDQK